MPIIKCLEKLYAHVELNILQTWKLDVVKKLIHFSGVYFFLVKYNFQMFWIDKFTRSFSIFYTEVEYITQATKLFKSYAVIESCRPSYCKLLHSFLGQPFKIGLLWNRVETLDIKWIQHNIYICIYEYNIQSQGTV